jgi:hypothetical protein
MFPKQALSGMSPHRLPILVGVALLVGGCSTPGPAQRAATPTVEPATAAETEPLPQTTTEAAVAAAGTRRVPAAGAAGAAAVESLALNPDAPAEYVVKRGDTLWDISALFLRDPWRWPEIWRANPQIENPDLIYPGDLLSLVPGADGGAPELRLTRRGGPGGPGGAGAGGGGRDATLKLEPLLRDSQGDGAIATIPYAAVAAFLERPSILSRDMIRAAPRIVGFVGGHMAGGGGSQAYVRNLDRADPGQRYTVVHVGAPIRDPDTNTLLGYQGIYTATAIVEEGGDPSRVLLADTARETLAGDRLIESERNIPLNFTPRAPSRRIEGRIVSVVDGVELIGQYRVVAINRGLRHGVEPGHVLVIEEASEMLRDRTRRSAGGVRTSAGFTRTVELPPRRNGTLLVFRSFDRMSYGLIVSITQPVRMSDVVRSP